MTPEELLDALETYADEIARDGILCSCGHDGFLHDSLGCMESLSKVGEPWISCECGGYKPNVLVADALRELVSKARPEKVEGVPEDLSDGEIGARVRARIVALNHEVEKIDSEIYNSVRLPVGRYRNRDRLVAELDAVFVLLGMER